jgi:hypothetical protein
VRKCIFALPLPTDIQDYFSRFPFAEIASQDGRSRLKFCTHAYEFPAEDSGSDADWQRNVFHLTIPSIRVEINEVIFTGHGLAFFLDELRALSTRRKPQIDFEPLEPYFGLAFSLIPKEKIAVKGRVQYPVGYGARLQFEFETDLTHLDKFIHGIEAILKNFPPR